MTPLALSVTIYAAIGVLVVLIATWRMPPDWRDDVTARWWLPPVYVALWPVAVLLAIPRRGPP